MGGSIKLHVERFRTPIISNDQVRPVNVHINQPIDGANNTIESIPTAVLGVT